jgi:hypothetical protein
MLCLRNHLGTTKKGMPMKRRQLKEMTSPSYENCNLKGSNARNNTLAGSANRDRGF